MIFKFWIIIQNASVLTDISCIRQVAALLVGWKLDLCSARSMRLERATVDDRRSDAVDTMKSTSFRLFHKLVPRFLHHHRRRRRRCRRRCCCRRRLHRCRRCSRFYCRHRCCCRCGCCRSRRCRSGRRHSCRRRHCRRSWRGRCSVPSCRSRDKRHRTDSRHPHISLLMPNFLSDLLTYKPTNQSYNQSVNKIVN